MLNKSILKKLLFDCPQGHLSIVPLPQNHFYWVTPLLKNHFTQFTSFFLSKLYTQCGAWTHHPDIESHMLYGLSQPRAPRNFIFFFTTTYPSASRILLLLETPSAPNSITQPNLPLCLCLWSYPIKKWYSSCSSSERYSLQDAWVAQSVKRLPSAQVMIPPSWNWVSHWAPCSAGRPPLPLPAAPPACANFFF